MGDYLEIEGDIIVHEFIVGRSEPRSILTIEATEIKKSCPASHTRSL
jgi:hypothetical protein